MRVALAVALALVACSTPKAFEDMSPEDRAAYLKYQQARVEIYLDFALDNAEKFVEAGKWEKADVVLAYTLAREGLRIYGALQELENGGTLEQQLDARLALERAIMKFIALGIDAAVGD